MEQRPNSEKIFKLSKQVIPGGVNSPVRAFKDAEITPLVLRSGKGAEITDVDENTYIDYCCSWGALALGHAHPEITESVIERVKLGSSFGTMTEEERDLATLLCSILPWMEKVRFVSSGTEAVMSAIRLARGYTGRTKIIKFNGNYHGHVDALLVQAGSGVMNLTTSSTSLGVPQAVIESTLSLPYNDVEYCREAIRKTEDLAAVILEPVAGNMGVVPASKEFLQMLREETQKKETLLIIDEVITGFRVSLQGAQGLYGITGDITVLGKIIGGGYPAAAFGGKKEIMDQLAPLGKVYQAGTLSGNPVAMVAGKKAVELLKREGQYEDLQRKTDFLLNEIEEFIKGLEAKICIQRVGSMFTFFFGSSSITGSHDLSKVNKEEYLEFFMYLFENGVYFPPSPFEACFVSLAHTQEQLVKTKNLILQFLSKKYALCLA